MPRVPAVCLVAVALLLAGGLPSGRAADSSGTLGVRWTAVPSLAAATARAHPKDDPATAPLAPRAPAGAGLGNSSVWSLDLLNDSLTPGLRVPPLCSAPAGLVYVPSDHLLYVAGYGSLNLCLVNLTSGLASIVPLPTDGGGAQGDPVAVAFDPSNGELYVANSGLDSDTITVVSATTDRVMSELTVGFSPDAIAYDSANGRLYVADGTGGVSIINGSDNAVVGFVGIPGEPDAVAYDPANGNLYVANLDSSNLNSGAAYSLQRW